MATLAVTDAHALIWYGLGRSRKLGRRAKRLFEQAEEGKAALYVPTIALVEISEAAWRGKIQFKHGFSAWADELFASGHFFCVDLTREVVEQAERLYRIPERGDRLIAATAAALDCPLITRDEALGEVTNLQIIW